MNGKLKSVQKGNRIYLKPKPHRSDISWIIYRIALLSLVCLQPLLVEGQFETQPLNSRKTTTKTTTLFEKVSPSKSNVSFEMTLPGVAQNFRELLQLAALGGIATGDINNDGLADFFVTSPLGGSRLFQNTGGFKFMDVTESSNLNQAGFWATGANFADINNDGKLDLYVCGYRMANRLYINQGVDDQGKVQFEEKANQLGLDYNGGSLQMYFADMDMDGDLDAYLATTAIPPPPGVKFQVRFEGKKPVVPEELKEYWDLIYLPGEKAHPSENGQYDHLFRNDGDRFTEITKEAGIDGPHLTLGAIWWDFNRDNWPDLYVANDYLGPDMLYLNQRDGTFRDVIAVQIPHTPWSSMGVDIGDLNNDGWMDLIACDMMGSTHYRRQVMMGETSRKKWFLDFAKPRQYSRNAVYLNTGTDRFMEIAHLTGMAATDWTWAPHIEDFDLDGRVDALFTNGMLRDVQHSDLANYADRTYKGGSPDWAKWWSEQSIRKESNFAFRNSGQLEFENVSSQWGFNQLGVSFGVASADFDNDGDLDLVINNADGPLTILRNNTSTGNSISVQLVGKQSNKFGIGATIKLESNGLIQSRHLVSGRSWLSASTPVSLFGLGQSTQVEELTVDWPDGTQQIFKNIKANSKLIIHEPETSLSALHQTDENPAQKTWFTQSEPLKSLIYRSKEFDDFTLQPLLPFRPSKTHYAVAWGDVNLDGHMDCFVGGGLGNTGSLFLGQKNGTFNEATLPTTQSDRLCFDTDAQLIDIDHDGDLDLVVTRHSPSADNPGILSGIELYKNDGKGTFSTATTESFPSIKPFVSCLAIADVDRDQDLDIFLGGGPIPGKYPLGTSAYLLINKNGQWADVTPDVLKNAWLTEDALWSDINGDKEAELIITTHWGNIIALQRQNGLWTDISEPAGLSNLKGWWNTITAADVDQDGDTDFIAGNRGWNTAYQPTFSHPDWLIYGDMDGNARHEIIEIYNEGDKRYPRRGFDSLSQSMPFMRQSYINFHQFSTTDIPSMFSTDAIRKSYKLYANTSSSGVLLNQGNLKLEFKPLPRLAQSAPINDIVVSDINQDGYDDLVIAQNDHSPQSMHGRMDGGVSMILTGNGNGSFDVVPPAISGVALGKDVRKISLIDIDGDNQKDLVFGVVDGSLEVFIRQ